MRLALFTIWLLASATITQAATITYSPTEQTGADTVNLVITFDDAAVANAIQGTIQIVPDGGDPDVGDIRAVYFDLVGLPAGITPEEVRAAISGADVTEIDVNTSGTSLGGGATIEPLGPFTIGIEIGSPGIGSDDIQTTTFLIDNSLIDPDLALSNFGAAAVRVTSIGLPGSSRSGSGKFLDEGGGGGPSEIPEPSTYVMTISAVAGLLLRRHFRS